MSNNPLAQALQASTEKQRQQQPAEPRPRNKQGKTRKDAAIAGKPQSQGREGKSMIGGFFDPEISRLVKILAAKQSTTTQALVEEGLRAVFKKYGEQWPE